MGVGTTAAEGRLLWKMAKCVVETSELDRQKCKNLWNVAKKITFLVGLGKIFGRPGQFLKVWKNIRNIREKISEKMYGKKSRGSKILATRGRGDFVKFYLAPQKPCCPSNAPPNSETWRRHWFVLLILILRMLTEWFCVMCARSVLLSRNYDAHEWGL